MVRAAGLLPRPLAPRAKGLDVLAIWQTETAQKFSFRSHRHLAHLAGVVFPWTLLVVAGPLVPWLGRTAAWREAAWFPWLWLAASLSALMLVAEPKMRYLQSLRVPAAIPSAAAVRAMLARWHAGTRRTDEWLLVGCQAGLLARAGLAGAIGWWIWRGPPPRSVWALAGLVAVAAAARRSTADSPCGTARRSRPRRGRLR